jgi:predicted alpha/beta-hydrolase family hydrolase
MPERFRIDVTASEAVTALLYPAAARDRAGIGLVLAHGAGANQMHAFMVRFASGLAARGIDAVTFNFLYTEQGRRLPDRNDTLELCWRKVLEACRAGEIGRKLKNETLAIGGKSMGGRIATQIAAAGADGISGLVLLGYPLHPPGQPEKLRARHLPAIRAPMLFVQGSRDAFGTPDELEPIIGKLKPPADLFVVENGDHSFKVAKKAGTPQEQVYDLVLDEIVHWLGRLGRRRAIG